MRPFRSVAADAIRVTFRVAKSSKSKRWIGGESVQSSGFFPSYRKATSCEHYLAVVGTSAAKLYRKQVSRQVMSIAEVI